MITMKATQWKYMGAMGVKKKEEEKKKRRKQSNTVVNGADNND